MSAVTYHQVENRLGKILFKPGGISPARALAAAESNLLDIVDDIRAGVDAALAKLEQAADAAAAGDLQARQSIYTASNNLAALCGNCGLDHLGRAAFGLCELVDRFIEADGWSSEAVTVHLRAFGLLRTPEQLGESVCESLLTGLNDLLAWAPKVTIDEETAVTWAL